jgi:hypothetical protein
MKDDPPTADPVAKAAHAASDLRAGPGWTGAFAGNFRWWSARRSFWASALAYRVSGLWQATLLIGLATAAHRFSANPIYFDVRSVPFPRGRLNGGNRRNGRSGGGILIAQAVSQVLEWTGNAIPFFIAASVIHLISPKLASARIGPG